MKVFINPGHSPEGKPDTGAVNEQAELRECDLALVIGQKVRLYLKQAGCETRLLQSDNLLGEGDGPCVTGAANAWGAELFVSVHCNAAQGDARGMEVLCYAMDSAGGRLANSIRWRLTGRIQAIDAAFSDRGVKERPCLAVLRATSMPAVLVETAFIDNMEDAWLLAKYPDEFARAIACGVTDYEMRLLKRE